MRRLLSSHLSFSGWLRPSPSRNCRVSQPAAAWRWTKLVAPGADAGVITSLTFIPAILLMMTSFTRSSLFLVYCVTRWERPPRHLTGIAGAGTIFDLFYYVTGDRQIYVDAYQPFSEEKISMQEAWKKGRSRYVSLCCVRPVRQIRVVCQTSEYRPVAGT